MQYAVNQFESNKIEVEKVSEYKRHYKCMKWNDGEQRNRNDTAKRWKGQEL